MSLLRLADSTSETNDVSRQFIRIDEHADRTDPRDFALESDEAALMALVEPDDEQGKLLIRVLAAASRYSSSKMIDRFKAHVSILDSMGRLMKEIQKEISDYKQMATNFFEISEVFRNEIYKFRRAANGLFQHLAEVNTQLHILLDEFLDLNRPLDEYNNQENIKLCIDILAELAGMEILSGNTVQTFGEISNAITEFQTDQVQPARIKAVKRVQRLQLIKYTAFSSTMGATIGAAIGGGLVSAPILGGAGAIVVGSLVCPPAAFIGGSIVLGLIAIGAIGLVISKLLRNYRTYSSTVVRNLEQLSALCDQMKGEAVFMKEKSDELALRIQNFSASMKGFKYGMHSEQQRRAHANICRKARETNQNLMSVLKEIIDFKIESLPEIERLMQSGNQPARCE